MTFSGLQPTIERRLAPSSRSSTTRQLAHQISRRLIWCCKSCCAHALRCTPPASHCLQVQRIFQLAAYKAKQESSGTQLTQDSLAELYNKRVRVSSGEKVSKYYVGQALRVYQHSLSDVTCRTLILEAQDSWQPSRVVD